MLQVSEGVCRSQTCKRQVRDCEAIWGGCNKASWLRRGEKGVDAAGPWSSKNEGPWERRERTERAPASSLPEGQKEK